MRIAYLINQYPSVSHTFIRREICELERQGHTVDRFTIRNMRGNVVDSSDIAELQRTSVLLQVNLCVFATLRTALANPFRFWEGLKQTIVLWRQCGGMVRHLAYLAEACHLRLRLPSDTQHVHAHFGTNSASVALLCRALGGPKFSFTVHGPEEFDCPKPIALEKKIAAAEFVVAVSSFGKSQLYRWSRITDWSKLHVIHCGLDDEFFSTTQQPPPQSPTLVCVGRLTEQKGQLVLIDAAKRLLEDGIDFRLVLVGDGELRDDLQSAIDRGGLRERITITGWQSGAEVRHHMVQARAMVLPSFAEGLPVVIMESLALARPVVSTYVAGIPELVVPGENGWLVPAGAVDDLVTAMREVLTASTDELFQMGLKGRERVRRSHSAKTEARRLAELIRSVV